jgi:hypothetical protein
VSNFNCTRGKVREIEPGVFLNKTHTYQTKFHRQQKSRNGNEEATVERICGGQKTCGGAWRSPALAVRPIIRPVKLKEP